MRLYEGIVERFRVSESSFNEIFPIWKNELWPDRIEPIEPASALLFKKGIDLNYRSAEVFFLKAELGGKIIGVLSGQKTGAGRDFRSRGLWVSKNFRRQGLGSKLFYRAEREAKRRKAVSLWTLARCSSKGFYSAVGMRSFGKTYAFEYSPHFWMSKILS